MASARSESAIAGWRESAEKFDYWVTGITGALTAYVGQNVHPARVGWNSSSAELVALALLVASVVCGFKRIETFIHFHRLQAQSLLGKEQVVESVHGNNFERAEEFRAAVSALDPHIDTLNKTTARYYQVRNWLLFAGFAVLVIARILPAYLG